jgi:hypothetical protein
MAAENNYYVHPQETWGKAECEKRAKHYARDGLGTKYPFPGYLGSSASVCSQFGRTRYNGGCVIDGEWYVGKEIPFPAIHEDYEIVVVRTWGWRIRKKEKNNA